MEAILSSNHAQIHQAILDYEETYERSVGGWHVNGSISYASVELEVGRLWHALVLLLQLPTVLRTGTHNGYSTACIASALASLGGPEEAHHDRPESSAGAGLGRDRVGVRDRSPPPVLARRPPDLMRDRMRFDACWSSTRIIITTRS